jgi:cellobiose phosphorylase
VIPKAWDGFKARRLFRGAQYDIQVRNPKHVSSGVKQIKLNGRTLEGPLVPMQKGKGPHRVEVLLG